MNETLEKLWYDYYHEESCVVETEEERNLLKQAAELREAANNLLNEEQQDAVDRFVDALCDSEGLFMKKAFFKGCEFAASVLIEAGDFKTGNPFNIGHKKDREA